MSFGYPISFHSLKTVGLTGELSLGHLLPLWFSSSQCMRFHFGGLESAVVNACIRLQHCQWITILSTSHRV